MILLALVAQAAEYNQLRAPSAEASSFLQSNWNKYTENYHANYLLDGDPKTAWVEGARGNGLGEWISWSVSPVAKADKVKVRIRNGYQKSDALLTANAAPSELSVVWLAGSTVVMEQKWKVDRKMGWQEIVLDPPVDRPFDGVRLNVLGVHEGRTYADLCISDAEVWVQSSTPFSAPVENAKHAALKSWIAERQATADYFASQPKAYPFAATSFVTASSEVPAGERAAVLARMAKRETERKQMGVVAPAWWRFEVKDRIQPPDGLDALQPEILRWFSPDRTYFEAEGAWRSTKKNVSEWHLEHREANAHLVKRADGTVQAATYGIFDTYEERGTYTFDRQYHLEFDEKERLVSIFGTWDSEGDGCDNTHYATVWDVTRDSEGRVKEIVEVEQADCIGSWDDDGGNSTSVQRRRYAPAGS
ncbi:MAG: hypothetical protein R3F61_12770 [Myxococcota bacterium]